jgi:hypothetical protein
MDNYGRFLESGKCIDRDYFLAAQTVIDLLNWDTVGLRIDLGIALSEGTGRCE